MPKNIAFSALNASTVDILNTIRQNAPFEYQSLVPAIETAHEIPKVGEIIVGNPALSNQFINSLVNRIAKVVIDSAIFNNPFRVLKKGLLSYGETVEEIFVNVIKALQFSAEKAEQRELKRFLPDVRSAFHAMNWSVVYPLTVQDDDLRLAFLTENGVTDLIARLTNSIYTSAEYDEYLLVKYLLIKAVNSGSVKIIAGGESATDNAVVFRSVSNNLTFMNSNYNIANVLTSTPRDKQYIFMSADFNARFDVEVLASAFNMDKADFLGKLILIDSFNTFDNDRFDRIRAQSDSIDEITANELEFMNGINAIIADEEFFQLYDNLTKFTEKYVGSGLYWNYFYHTRKIISYSPFSNIVAIGTPILEIGESYNVTVTQIIENGNNIILIMETPVGNTGNNNILFDQNEDCTEKGIAVQKYGVFTVPNTVTEFTASMHIANSTFTATVTLANIEIGSIIEFA